MNTGRMNSRAHEFLSVSPPVKPAGLWLGAVEYGGQSQ